MKKSEKTEGELPVSLEDEESPTPTTPMKLIGDSSLEVNLCSYEPNPYDQSKQKVPLSTS